MSGEATVADRGTELASDGGANAPAAPAGPVRRRLRVPWLFRHSSSADPSPGAGPQAGHVQMTNSGSESGVATRAADAGARRVGVRESVAAGLEATADLLRLLASVVTPAPRPVKLRAYVTPSTLAVKVPSAEVRARRLAAAKRGLLEHAGGGLTAAEVAALLGVADTDVEERRRGGVLLAVPVEGGHVFPGLQFANGGVVPGFDRVLGAFRLRSPWSVLSVLVGSAPALGGRSPIEALRSGDVDAVIRFAHGAGEQGG